MRDADERDKYETVKALRTVLNHQVMVGGEYIDLLVDGAKNFRDERAKKACRQTLAKLISNATSQLANIEGHREEILKSKGLSQGSVEHTHKLDLGSLDVERLKALAAGQVPTVEGEATVVDVDGDDELLAEPE